MKKTSVNLLSSIINKKWCAETCAPFFLYPILYGAFIEIYAGIRYTRTAEVMSMDCKKVGQVIRFLRQEQSLTQKQLADKMNISDKTISKWERGFGCPDISLLAELSDLLGVNIEEILCGDLSPNRFVGGNMKNSKYFVCPVCGNISLCTGDAVVSCCGRKLEALKPQKATEEQKLTVEQIEDDWYITSSHPMTKEQNISFVAFATGDKVQIIKQYPEWNLQARIQKRGHGMLLWYSTQDKLLYQLL